MAFVIFKSERAIGYYFDGRWWREGSSGAKRYKTRADAEKDVSAALKQNAVGKRKRRDVQIREI